MNNFKNKLFIFLISFSMTIGTYPLISYANDISENTYDETYQEEQYEEEQNLEEEQYYEENQNKDESLDTTSETMTVYYHFYLDGKNKELVEPIKYENVTKGESLDFSKDINLVFDELAKQDYQNCSTNMVTEYPVVGEGSENGLDVTIDENNDAHFSAYLEYSPFKVTYRYLEEGSEKELREPIIEPIMSYMIGSDQTKTSVEIEGYEFVIAKGDIELKREEVEPFITPEEIEDGAQEIIYYFKSTSEVVEPSEKPDDKEENNNGSNNENEQIRTFNVYFYYVDAFTGEYIATPETWTLDYEGEGYCLDAPYKIGNYELLYSDYYYGTCDSEDDIVVYSFYLDTNQKIGKHKVIINYLEEGTDKVISNQFVSCKVDDGFKYNVKCQTNRYIAGYEFVKTTGNVSGIINGQDEVINVYYRKIKPNPAKKNIYNVSINYLDENGNKIYRSFTTLLKEEGSFYDVTEFDAIEIDGYTYYKTVGDDLRGVLDKNKEVNVIYKKYDPNIVKTSDNNNLIVWIFIGTLGIILLVFIIRKNKK